MRTLSLRTASALLLVAACASQAFAQERPLSFMDVQLLKSGGSWTPSPDGEWMLYTVSTPDWAEAERQTDIHVVSLVDGYESSRQLTFTDDKNETQPAWAPDGSYFVFLSDRDSGRRSDRDADASDEERRGGSQLYLMRHDGGEARRVTDMEDGVSGFSFSPTGDWLVFRSGESGQEQLHRLPVSDLFDTEPVQITRGEAGVDQWDWSPDGRGIYFARPDSFDEDEKRRWEEGFTVDIKNGVTPLSSLWSVAVADGRETRLTDISGFSVNSFVISPDGAWISFTGGSPERYERNITAQRLYADQYLLEIGSGHIERLTDNFEIGESATQFSPDGRWIAFSGPDDMERYSMTENRVYIRELSDRVGPSASSVLPSIKACRSDSGPKTRKRSTSTPVSKSRRSFTPWTSNGTRCARSPTSERPSTFPATTTRGWF